MLDLINYYFKRVWLLLFPIKEGPKVTLVVPFYNDQNFVLQALKSIQQQSYKNLEVLIINDASGSDSLEKLKSFVGESPIVQIINHTENKGLSAARNTGLKLARGEYITFLDSDDFLDRHSIALRARRLMRETQIDKNILGVFQRIIFTPFNSKGLRVSLLGWWPFKGKGIVDKFQFTGGYPFPVHGPLLVTSKVRELGGFDESMKSGVEDLDLWYRAIVKGWTFLGIAGVGGAYRQKPQSMLHDQVLIHTELVSSYINKYFYFMKEQGFERAAKVRDQAMVDRVSRYAALFYCSQEKIDDKFYQLLSSDEQKAEIKNNKHVKKAFDFSRKLARLQGKNQPLNFEKFQKEYTRVFR